MPANNHYGEVCIEEYIRLLGCWRYADPAGQAHKRDSVEYRKDLERLIKVNETRKDRIGFLETEAAKRALRSLGI
jgi:hypothetical protein